MSFERKIDPSTELAARIAHIECDRFINHSLAVRYLGLFEELLTTTKPKHYLITGESGNGKSELVEQFIRKHQFDINATGDAARIPAVHATMPEKCRLGELGDEILDALMQEPPRSTTAMQKMRMARKLTKNLNVRIVFLDEIQHLSLGGPINREETKNGLKRYMKECGASIVALGMPKGLGIIHGEPQLNRHFKKLTLPPWQADDEGRSLIHNLEAGFELAHPPHLAQNAILCCEIFALAEGVLQHVVDIMQQAAIVAVITGKERITREIIKSLGWVKDSEGCQKAALDLGIRPTAVGIGNSKPKQRGLTRSANVVDPPQTPAP